MYDEHGAVAPRTLYGVYKLANEGTRQGLLAGRRRRQRRPPAVLRLRPRPRPGPDRRPDARDRRRGARRAVPDRASAAARSSTTRPTSRGRSSRPRAREPTGAHAFSLGGPATAIADFVAAVEAEVPGAEITFDDAPLPVPGRAAAALVRLAAHAARAGHPRDRRGSCAASYSRRLSDRKGRANGRDPRLRPRRRVPDQGEGAVPVRLRRARRGRPARRRLQPPGRAEDHLPADRVRGRLHGRRVLPRLRPGDPRLHLDRPRPDAADRRDGERVLRLVRVHRDHRPGGDEPVRLRRAAGGVPPLPGRLPEHREGDLEAQLPGAERRGPRQVPAEGVQARAHRPPRPGAHRRPVRPLDPHRRRRGARAGGALAAC